MIRWDGSSSSQPQRASHDLGDDLNGDGDSEASSRSKNSEEGRRKLFRKSRKKSLSPPGERSPYNNNNNKDDSSTDDDEEDERSARRLDINFRRNSLFATASFVSSGLSRTLEVDGQPQPPSLLRRVRASSLKSGKFFLSRTQSSPSGLGIAEFLASRQQQQLFQASQNKRDQESLPSCQSSAIRLENRLTPDLSFCTPVRPKLLALGDGSVSVEPRVRKSLSRGTPIRSQSVCFGSIFETTEDILAASFAQPTDTFRRGKIAEQIISGLEKKSGKSEKKKKQSKQNNSATPTPATAAILAGRVNKHERLSKNSKTFFLLDRSSFFVNLRNCIFWPTPL